MLSPASVITFDIIKHRSPHCFLAKVFSVDIFHCQRMREALHADYAALAAPSAENRRPVALTAW
ncbi:hypothetical protein EC960497_A0084 [Escherichia coli 96.0497]|nr:hypothetical protein EC960497_A0084 [Escherichia coli 96.0497]